MLTPEKRQALAQRILEEKDSNLVAHAERELAFLSTGDEMNEAMRDDLLEIVLVFSTQGHSGFSASYATQNIEKLLRFEPLRPLTGEDDEWNEIGKGEYQNRRCSHVFKSEAKGAYDINGRIFREPDGCCFTNGESRVPVEFPYTPSSEIIEVDKQA